MPKAQLMKKNAKTANMFKKSGRDPGGSAEKNRLASMQLGRGNEENKTPV